MDKVQFVIGLAGGSGAGKTTLAEKLVSQLGTQTTLVLPHDAYYRDLSDIRPEERVEVNFDHPDALETELMVEQVARLKKGEAVDVPIYDFGTHTRRADEVRNVEPRSLLILEGILLLTDERLRAQMDLRVFIDTSEDVRLQRRIERDVVERGRSEAFVRTQFYESVKPMHDQFMEPSRVEADLIVSEEGGLDAVVSDLLLRIPAELR